MKSFAMLFVMGAFLGAIAHAETSSVECTKIAQSDGVKTTRKDAKETKDPKGAQPAAVTVK